MGYRYKIQRPCTIQTEAPVRTSPSPARKTESYPEFLVQTPGAFNRSTKPAAKSRPKHFYSPDTFAIKMLHSPDTLATLQPLPALIFTAWQHERALLGDRVVCLGGLLRGGVDNPEHRLAVQGQADHDGEVSGTLNELLEVRIRPRNRPDRGRGSHTRERRARAADCIW